MMPKFEREFDRYICERDTLTTEIEGFEITARIVYDQYSNPKDYDCYEPEHIEAWKRDEWFYAGVALSVAKNDIVLEDNAASLWGVEVNFPGGNNSYVTEVANELISEALSAGKQIVEKLCSCK